MRRPSADEILTRPGDGVGVGVVTLSSPATRNALTLAMWAGPGLAFRQLLDDPGDFHRVHLAVEHTIATSPKPVIAAIVRGREQVVSRF